MAKSPAPIGNTLCRLFNAASRFCEKISRILREIAAKSAANSTLALPAILI
jgi:hypothetical protein